MRYKGFIGPAYQLRSVNADCQRCVNLYPEINESQQARPGEVGTLVGTPGLRLLNTIGTGPIRGVHMSSWGILYVVSGGTCYWVSNTWTATSLGTLSTNFGPVGMADNGKTLCIVDGPYGYIWDQTTWSLRSNLDGFTGGINVVFLDGYLITNQPGTQYFWISGLYNPSVSGIDFAAAEGSPDQLLTILENHRELWLFGENSAEVFFNSGNPDFPFERIQGAFMEAGCVAKYSPAKATGIVFWLGKDDNGSGIVWAAKGYLPQRISTHAIEQVIQTYNRIDDAVGFAYQQSGHNFYVLTFPDAGATWVYDLATNLWHQRAALFNGSLTRIRANCHAFAYGSNVVGDWENGNLYALDPLIGSDNGVEIPRIRTAPHLADSLNRVFYESFQLDLETGVGLDGTAQGTNPQIMLRWSDDSGHSWSNEHWVSAGKIGMTKARAIWNRLGYARDRVFEVRISDPVPVTLLGAEIRGKSGAS